jgi:hypothetical protein
MSEITYEEFGKFENYSIEEFILKLLKKAPVEYDDIWKHVNEAVENPTHLTMSSTLLNEVDVTLRKLLESGKIETRVNEKKYLYYGLKIS